MRPTRYSVGTASRCQSSSESTVAIVGGGDDPLVAAYAVFHPDVELADARLAVENRGARVVDALESINGLVIEIPGSELDGLIDDEMTQWVEAALPRMDVTNASNRVVTQADDVHAAPYNLDGTGVSALVYDAGTARATHLDFSGRLTVHDASGGHYHANHVSGTVGGAGVANATHTGMAPNCTIRSMGFEYDGSGTFLYTNPGDIETDYDTAFNTLGVHVANNSIGTNTESNGFPCSYQGDYGVTSNLLDTIITGSLGTPVRVCWAAGNERQGSRCDVEGFGDYYSSAPPSNAKNIIGVGAVNSNNESMTSFSSWGPSDDGRLRPDIVGPGCESGGDGGVTSTGDSSDTAYLTLCGTSMATPTVTGLVCLLLEDFNAQFPADPWPINSTIKAMLAHSAVDLGNPGPDYQFGYGSVRVKDTIDHMRTGRFYEESVDQGGSWSALSNVGPGTPELKITLAWDDAAATPNVSVALVNDLDLVVIDPSGGRHHPWTLNPSAPSVAAVQTAEDHLNNMEQVVVQNPEAGTWTVEVAGTTVPQGPQTFSLVASEEVLQTGIQMSVSSAGGVPEYVDPSTTLNLEVDIVPVAQNLVAGSASLYWRHNADPFTQVQMTNLVDDTYLASIPVPDCGNTFEFYFSAEGDVLGVSAFPTSAPGVTFTAIIGEESTPIAYSFEAVGDEGWAVDAEATDTATSGIWGRMDPESTLAQPEDDVSDPGVNAWVTDGLAGASLGERDVDGGQTTLYSPIIDLSGLADATLSYWRWYSNDTGADPNNDVFVIDISDDGGSNWVNVETVGPGGSGTSGGWIQNEFLVSDFVAPTSQVRLRFAASDLNAGSLVEAAIDELAVTSVQCVPAPEPCAGDVNGDGRVDIFDFGTLATNFGITSGAVKADGDLDGDGDIDAFDFAILAGSFGEICL